MKKINLVKGYVVQVAQIVYSGEITSILSAVKLSADKKELGVTSWTEIARSQESFIVYIDKLEQHTGCKAFKNPIFIDFIKSLSEDEFKQLISLLSESQITTNNLEIVNAYSTVRDNVKDYFEMSPNAFNVGCELGNVKEAATIVDSFSFSVNTLVGLSNYYNLQSNTNTKVNYYAVEKDANEYEMAQLKAYLLVGDQAVIKCGDSLEQPIFIEGDALQQFDYALSIPPMGAHQKMSLKRDKYNRFTSIESQIGSYISSWHYVEHMLTTSKEKVIALLPLGALFSTRPIDKRIREKLIEEDLIEGVIYLPNSIFSGSAVNTCWVILNKHKDKKLKNKIMFIDLTNKKERINRRRFDVPAENVKMAKMLYDNMTESEISFVVAKEWFKENQYTLDILDAIKRERALEGVNQTPMLELRNIAEIKRGVQVPKSKIESLKTTEATHYMISLGNIQDGKIILDETSKILPEERWKELYELEAGDILITSKGNVMKVAMVGAEIKNAIVTANLFCIRVDKNKYSPEVLKYYLESEKGMQLLDALTRGAVIKSLASSDLEKLLIPNISLKEQVMVSKLITRVEEDYKKDLEIAERRYKGGKISVNELLGL